MVETVVATTGSLDSPPPELGATVVEVCSFGLLTESSLVKEGLVNATGVGGLWVTGGNSGSGVVA